MKSNTGKKKVSRILSLLLAAVMVAALLAGCGGSKSDSSSGGSTATEAVTEAKDLEAPATEAPAAEAETEAPETEAVTEAAATEAQTEAAAAEAETEAVTEAEATEAQTEAEAVAEATEAESDAEAALAAEEESSEAAETEAVTEAAETEAVTEAVTEAAATEAGTEGAETEAVTEAAATEAETEGAETEAVTEAAATEAVTEAAETEAVTEAVSEAAETEAAQTEGQEESTEGESDAEEPAEAPDAAVLPGIDESDVFAQNADRDTVNIRFAQFGNSVDDIDGMENDPVKKTIEETVNITLEYDTGTDGFDERMQTELFTGGAADLFPTWGESEKIKKWIEEDLVLNIAEVINAEPDRYPTLYKIINSPEYKAYNNYYSGDENAAYAIYSVAAYSEPSFAGVPVYNTAILNEVNGGKVPATVDEFVEFTKACGEAGYVGWWPRNDKLTNWQQIDKTLASPRGTSIMPPSGDAWTGFVPDGEIGTDSEHWTLATVSDESKEVVRQLADMYAAGGLDTNIGVKGDFDDAYSDFGAGKIGAVDFGFGYPGQFRDFYKSAWLAANPDAQMSDLTVGTALTADGSYGKTYTTGTWIGAHYFIPTTCEYPDRVLDLVEFLASTNGQDLLHNTDNYAFREDQGAEFWQPVNAAYGYNDNRCKYVWFSYLFSGTEYELDFANNDWWTAVSHPIDNSDKWATEEDVQLVDYARGVVSEFVDEAVGQLPGYYNMVSLAPEAADIRTKMQDITNQYLTQMIGGRLDIDEGWADYVSEYEAAGAADLETMVNDAIAAAREAAQ